MKWLLLVQQSEARLDCQEPASVMIRPHFGPVKSDQKALLKLQAKVDTRIAQLLSNTADQSRM